MSRIQDALGVMKGLQYVAQAGVKLQEENLRQIWINSSLRSLAQQVADQVKTGQVQDIKSAPTNVIQTLTDGAERVSSVLTGLKEFTTVATSNALPFSSKKASTNVNSVASTPSNLKNGSTPESNKIFTEYQIKLTDKDKELLKKLDMEHQRKMELEKEIINLSNVPTPTKSENVSVVKQTEILQHLNLNSVTGSNEKIHIGKEDVSANIGSNAGVHSYAPINVASGVSVKEDIQTKPKVDALPNPKIGVVPNPKSKLKLSATAKQRAVPSSRIGRMVSFGSLAAGLGIGTVAEYTRRIVGLGEPPSSNNLFLSQANMERIVDTLCKVRGAALKLGQVLSIQDENIISPELARALERVRKSADFMPTWQVEQVMKAELGENWREKLLEFDDKPFAAASIGQVHWGKTKNGEEVAIKIQYPGVAKGINSDIENLLGIMKVWNIFPQGMFLDNVADVAKRELAWEVDYVREAECTRKFKKLLEPYPDYFVPKVIDEISSAQVFTTQLVDGTPVDQCIDLDQDERNYIGEKILELSLLELLEFQYMQTDPNWANFLYNRLTKQMVLLDFGASREYSKKFMDTYIRIIKAAADDDRDTVLQKSKDIGFFTGYESKIMEDAHVDAVMILGEMFRTPGQYDFSKQNATARIQNLVPTMITHRLCPPPEEIYSIHRKLSGVFLLCAKLKSVLNCRDIFHKQYSKYKFDS